MSSGLVSVIIPAKNSARTLGLCLTSLARQTYRPIEVIVVDNGSTDETVAVAEYHGVTVIHSGAHLPALRNAGARAASGDWLLHLDSDMELDPKSIAQCVEVSMNGADVVILPERNVSSGYWMKAFSFYKELTRGVPGCEGVRFVGRTWFDRVGGYDESISLSGEDRDFFLRLLGMGARPACIKALTMHHVEHLTIRDVFCKTAQYTRLRHLFIQKYPSVVVTDKILFLRLFTAQWRVMAKSPLVAAGWIALTALMFVRDRILLYQIGRTEKERHR